MILVVRRVEQVQIDLQEDSRIDQIQSNSRKHAGDHVGWESLSYCGRQFMMMDQCSYLFRKNPAFTFVNPANTRQLDSAKCRVHYSLPPRGRSARSSVRKPMQLPGSWGCRLSSTFPDGEHRSAAQLRVRQFVSNCVLTPAPSPGDRDGRGSLSCFSPGCKMRPSTARTVWAGQSTARVCHGDQLNYYAEHRWHTQRAYFVMNCCLFFNGNADIYELTHRLNFELSRSKGKGKPIISQLAVGAARLHTVVYTIL